MAKHFPSAEFKTAVKALNEVLKNAEEKPIKFVGIKKADVIESFTETILDYIKKEKVENLPDEAIDFYNSHIANDENEDKKKKKKKAPAKKAPAKKASGPGICVTAIKAYMEDDCKTLDEIVDYVQPSFPERNIRKTISHVFGVLKHIKPYDKE